MIEIKEFIQKYTKLLPVGSSISYTDAEYRAGEFLSALAQVTDVKHLLTTDKIRLLSVQTAVYAEELSKGTDKTVTVNKTNAEASKPYLQAREELEKIENDIAYLRAYYEVFINAHQFYRMMAKEGQN